MSTSVTRHVESLVLDMESNVADVKAWATALRAVGTYALPIDPAAVYVMAVGLERTANALTETWRDAADLVKSRRPEGDR